MRPDDPASALGAGRLDELGPADDLVSVGIQAGNDEFALFIADEKAVALRNQERVPPASLTREIARVPDAPTRGRVEAAYHSVAAYAVNVAAAHDRRRHDAVEPVGLPGLLASTLAPPKQAGGRSILSELQHERTVVKRREKESIALEHRRGNRQIGFDLERHRPVRRARFRIERDDGLGVPDDELPCSAGREDDRRAVPRILKAQRPPDFLARILVEGDDTGSVRPADQADQSLAVDERSG